MQGSESNWALSIQRGLRRRQESLVERQNSLKNQPESQQFKKWMMLLVLVPIIVVAIVQF